MKEEPSKPNWFSCLTRIRTSHFVQDLSLGVKQPQSLGPRKLGGGRLRRGVGEELSSFLYYGESQGQMPDFKMYFSAFSVSSCRPLGSQG